ncbi:MAG: nucleotidyltransferase domain-containing protein [Chitinivibrionales bacterium]|nr:nucleotidyltransferase domain-containing protein [Chitinivibrionales bacterium]
MYTKRIAITEAVDFVRKVQAGGIHVSRAFLFGSYAQDSAREDSDIDVALVSSDFSGFRFDDLGKIAAAKIRSCSDIEAHTFAESEFTEDNPFARVVIKTGLKLY